MRPELVGVCASLAACLCFLVCLCLLCFEANKYDDNDDVCLSLCLRECVCPRSHPRDYTSNLHQIVVHVTYGRGSDLPWRRSDTLCTSGFTDDVIFAHKPRLLDVAVQLKSSARAALGSATNCAQ